MAGNVNIIDNIDINTVYDTMRKINQMHTVLQNSLVKDYDYGIIPGTTKPTLLKPGGEKICMLFNVYPEYEFLKVTEEYEKNFFSYNLKCILKRDGETMAEGVGSCNSKEKKYRYIFVNEVPENYLGSSEKVIDKYGNTKYKIENQDLCNFANTILKMAKKRAFIDAVLQLASLSDIFTQDLEDFGEIINYSRNEKSTAGDIKLEFGKYKGKTLKNVYETDSKYFYWLKNNDKTDDSIRKACANLEKLEGVLPSNQ
ncbi:MAG: hypothetical protein IJS47_03290 [Clostridia bacterium]|nr:hypothetical protein [Clostridia bacterium]